MTHDESDYWVYRAERDRVVDGDTIDLTVDLGFRTYKQVRVRLANVDTAEIYGVDHDSDEFQLGQEQVKFVTEWIENRPDGKWPLHFVSHEESGKYGRWIGDIYIGNESLSEAILEKWPEAEYDG